MSPQPPGQFQWADALQGHMIPQSGREGPFSAQRSQENAPMPWSISKVEKQKYDRFFDSWVDLRTDLISEVNAFEILNGSGLRGDEIMQIWCLANPRDKGNLNRVEFTVAMHLASAFFPIFRTTLPVAV